MVKFSLGTEQRYQHFCVILAEALIGIHACKHRIPAVGVQYILHETCSVPTSAVSVHPWAPLEVGANPPTQLSSFQYLLRYRCRPQCAGSRGGVDSQLRLPTAWVFTIVEILLCWKPIQHTHCKLKSQGQNITWKLMEWKRSSNKMISCTSRGIKVCFWTWNSEAEEPFS